MNYHYGFRSLMAETPAELGAYLRILRERAGLTQSEVALDTHLPQSMISRLERGDPGVRIGAVMTVLARFGMYLPPLVLQDDSERQTIASLQSPLRAVSNEFAVGQQTSGQ